MNEYITKVIQHTKEVHPFEPTFQQAVGEVLTSLSPVVEEHPEYEETDLLTRLAEPERSFSFRVVWEDDEGRPHTNVGYRVQFNGAIGPYKGGLRFQPNVNLDILHFLGFEQTFKNSLTGLPMGGGKGGADFNPVGRSEREIMHFCQSYMDALYRFIGPDIDVPAGDMGVGSREIGYLFGQYRRLKGDFEGGVLTGKDVSFGGSRIRPQATGYGAVYYLENVLHHDGEELAGKTIAISGFGNVAWGVCSKATERGAKFVTLSGPDGYIYDPDGVNTPEKLQAMLEMRASGRNQVKDYADRFGVAFYPGKKPWGVPVDIVMPCAVENDVGLESAKAIAEAGTRYYIEVANMPTTAEALHYLSEQKNMITAPAKAVNAGGVSVSGLEMSQDSERLTWSAEEVDHWLHRIMNRIYEESVAAADTYGLGYNLVAGGNIAGFERVAKAMMLQGIF